MRRARREDVPAIVRLVADDQLGRTREQVTVPLPDAYYAAFDRIEADPGSHLMVAEVGDRVVGTLQLNVIPYLTRVGRDRGHLEAVRVASEARGQGIGRQMVAWAIEESRRRGCQMIQLTTDRRRDDAKRFYERLGFEATHHGMKLPLD